MMRLLRAQIVLLVLFCGGCSVVHPIVHHVQSIPRSVARVFGFGAKATAHSVTLTWTASVPIVIAGYNVYVGSVSGGPYTKQNTSLITTLSFVDTNVRAGQTIFFVVTTVDTAGAESKFSTEETATVPSTSQSVTLTWPAAVVTPIAGYNIYRSAVSGGPYVKQNTALITALTFTDTNVSSGQTLFYVATAVNSSVPAQESIFSVQVSATIPSSSPPNAPVPPTNVTAH
jgi:hypothetical protein